MPLFEEWKNVIKRVKRFTIEECEAMEKPELIELLLVWQDVSHNAMKIISMQDEIFKKLELDKLFSDKVEE
jgi:hypothetical protein